MKLKRLGKWLGITLVGVLVLLALVPTTAALQALTEQEVIIPADQVITDDLLASADRFVLNGTVQGDLIVAANTIEINGIVEGDLWAGGQTVVVNGTVKDDLRIAGASLTLGENAQVNDDAIVLGYSLETSPGSVVNGEMYFAGGQSRLAGRVANNLWVSAGGLELLGSVGGNVEANVATPEGAPPFSPFAFTPNAPSIPAIPWGLTVGPNAQVDGNLKYASSREFSVPVGAVIGRITSELVPTQGAEEVITPAMARTNWLLEQARRLVALLIVGLLLVWLTPTWLKQLGETVEKRPLASLCWGLVGLALFVVVLLVLLFVMIALATLFSVVTLSSLTGAVVVLGLLALFAFIVGFSLFVGYVAQVMVGLLAGRLLLARLAPDWAGSRVATLVLGIVLLVLLTAVPYIGGWLNFAVILFGLGALWLRGEAYMRQWQTAEKMDAPPKPAVQPI